MRSRTGKVFSGLWAITSYFNPLGYQTRRRNYRLFRDGINAPLLTVELGREGSYQLEQDDADLLVRIPSGDILWQKERLLNIALDHLPGDCTKVAWVDCDILFERKDWAARSCEALDTYSLIQPFTRVYHLRRDADISRCGPTESSNWQESMAGQYSKGSLNLDCLRRNRPLDSSFGQAWAMRRSDLEAVGFYDAAILGGGTVLSAAAAIGHFDEAAGRMLMSRSHTEHYLRWAKGFHRRVRGKVASLEGNVFHLWHGDRKDRGYGTRHLGMKPFDFDPERDLAFDKHGSWRWNSDKRDLHDHVERYFEARLEDGI